MSQHVEDGDLGSNVRLSYRCAFKNLPGSVDPTVQVMGGQAFLVEEVASGVQTAQGPAQNEEPHCEASHFRPV